MADGSVESDDSQTSSMKESPRVIIIGAGISGVSCGSYLAKAGFNNFVILEATARTGGRIWSIEMEHANGILAELGANWIHGVELNPIYKLCMQNDLLRIHYEGRKLGRKVMFVTEKAEPVNTKIVEEVDWEYGMLMQQCEEFFQDRMPTPEDNDSVGAFLTREFLNKMYKYHGKDLDLRKMILTQRMIGESIISGSHDMFEVSLSEYGSLVELPGVHYVIPPGFESVVHLLEADIPKENILLEHPVTRINWNQSASNEDGKEQAVCVECQNGKKFYADHVLVTCSLGYLKKNAGRLFNPSLPEFKLSCMDNIAFGCVNKVILQFAGQILPDEVFRLEMVWDRRNIDEEPMETRWVKKIGSWEAIADNVLVGWLSGREAEYMETLTEEQLAADCLRILKQFLHKAVKDIPPLKKIIRSTWKTNPYYCGSYSFIPVGISAEEVENMAEPVTDEADRPIIMFAGEATHPQWYSSSHGALMTGQREAQRVLDLYPNLGDKSV